MSIVSCRGPDLGACLWMYLEGSSREGPVDGPDPTPSKRFERAAAMLIGGVVRCRPQRRPLRHHRPPHHCHTRPTTVPAPVPVPVLPSATATIVPPALPISTLEVCRLQLVDYVYDLKLAVSEAGSEEGLVVRTIVR